jgi:hypothetical protein
MTGGRIQEEMASLSNRAETKFAQRKTFRIARLTGFF